MPYLSVDNLDATVPTSKVLDPTISPLDTMKIRNHGVAFSAFDDTVRSPYTQSLNLSLTRIITNNITLDVRYVGALARKGIGSIDINTPNFINNGLLTALDEARKGNNPELFDKMFQGIQFAEIDDSIAAIGSPGALRGGDVIRRKWGPQLANGDYASIATSLANLNYDKQALQNFVLTKINQTLPDVEAGEQGAVLRVANANHPGMFPENYILANPQLSTAELRSNLIHSNYHSMQVQLVVRPVRGISFTSTYTWSKSLADQPGIGGIRGGGSWTDPTNRALDYKLSYAPRHQWNTYGYMDLPFGANGFFFRTIQNGFVRRALEGWQLSWTMGLQSGSPQQVSGGVNHLYDNATLMDLVGSKNLAPGKGRLDWAAGDTTGYYYGAGNNARYVVAADPQCDRGSGFIGGNSWDAASGTLRPLTDSCSLQALYLRNPDGSRGQIILQNPLPGHQGTFSDFIEGIGSVSLNGAVGKEIRIAGDKSLNFRMDCKNILNHPTPDDPFLVVGGFGNTFGTTNAKTGTRTVQASIRLKF
jgi:hypothetical protein